MVINELIILIFDKCKRRGVMKRAYLSRKKAPAELITVEVIKAVA